MKIAEDKYKKLKALEDDRINNPYKIKITSNKNIKLLFIIFIICLFTGLLTPIGDTPYTYLIKTMQGISTKNINEHLPVVLADNISLLIVFGIYIVTISLTKIKLRLSDLFMVAGLSILTIFTKRQVSMLYLIGVIILNRIITNIIHEYEEDKLAKWESRASKFIGVIVISVIVITCSILQYKQKKNDEYIDENSYPVQASEWIKENLNLDEIKLYNEYNYGSYLLYKEIPVFIDSRCDLYMPEFNENVNVFKDFLDLNNANFKDMEAKISEYGFTHFIIHGNPKIKTYLISNPDKYKIIYPTGEIEDENFTIFERM